MKKLDDTIFTRKIKNLKLLLFLILSVNSNLNADTIDQSIQIKPSVCKFLDYRLDFEVKSYLHFPIPKVSNHSMSYALPKYTCQKIPCQEIERIVKNKGKIRVIGVPPEVLKTCPRKIDFPISYKSGVTRQKKGKKENIYRPFFYKSLKNDNDMYVSVISGEDYIKQVSGLIAFHIESKIKRNSNDYLSVTVFPKLEASLSDWTNIKSFIEEGDTVLIGNVAYFYDYFRDHQKGELLSEKESFFYKSRRIKFKSRVLNFLIINHTFWGSMSSLLSKEILKKNIYELIYMSKVATLSSPSDIYNKVFSPNTFFLLKGSKIEAVKNVKNELALYYPKNSSGPHISVPTVIEEDMKMTTLARSIDSRSLDLELSNIAKEISFHNTRSSGKTKFGSIHIVTDYLRGKGEGQRKVDYDLSNSRDKNVRELKIKSWKKIYKLLIKYFENKLISVDRSGLVIGYPNNDLKKIEEKPL